MASTAAKPCQEDSYEFYLITGSIYIGQQGTVQLLVQDESRFKTSCLIDKDKLMMKAQVYAFKSSAISDIQALPQKSIIDKITHEVLVIMLKKMLREIVSKRSRP
ncbi:hypothetical protein Tco_0762858 [Tanacetum coccineum]